MMKRMMLVAAVAVLAMPAMASAQGASVSARASVAQYSNVTGTTDLDFGVLSRTVDNTISAVSGAVTRTVSYNHNVTVSFSGVPASLTGAASAYALPVSLMCAWSQDGATGWSSAAACGTASFDLTVGTGRTDATLGFGGTITAVAASAAAADSYAGSMTVTIVAR